MIRASTPAIRLSRRATAVEISEPWDEADQGGFATARGTHDELLGTSSVYREIYEHGLLERQFADAVEARAEIEEVA